MTRNKEKFYLIHSDILPESIYKTVEAKKLVETGEVETVHQAVERVGLSRSAYYKYKDKIFPFNAATYKQIVTFSLILEHRSGILSNVLRFVAEKSGNILTINQSIPLQGIANVVLSVDTASLNLPTSEFIDELSQVDGVRKVVIVGQG
ncbi:MAG TPA: ACT domain-containing protein [Bacillus sp. (in: firmicutes)]|uniref:ACT domain-containing protein n=1 Tax=Bacillus litorisediminis TaxID=2922713 RepID=UPI001FAC3B80|nr:ACT domain-containing protein [Bacillus litorisediminis]HWO76903.1 ACT domain-containing protein [Bacillus sp. (in: firmicutes)]